MSTPLLVAKEIHRFKENGTYILFDVANCSAREVDQLTYEVLELFAKPAPRARLAILNDKNEMCLLERALDALLAEGVVTAVEGVMQDAGRPDGSSLPESQIVRLSLNLSEACNMDCKYCYARGGAFYGGTPRMTEQVAERAVDFLLAASKDERKCSIIFFGGEPLLNFALLKHVVAYAKNKAAQVDKTIAFSLLTNGTLVNQRTADFLSREGVAVNISIDGPKDIHDSTRYFRGGKGTHDILIRKIALLQSTQRIPLNAKPTITHQDTDAWRVYSYLLSLGFTSMKMEPVSTQDAEFAMTPKDISELNQHLATIAHDLLKRWLNGQIINFISLTEPVAKLCVGKKNFYRCDAGLAFLAVSAQGDLYPCYAFPGMKDFKLGNVFDGLDRDRQNEFQKYMHVNARKECSTCWARYVCGGECYYHSAKFTGNLEHVSGNVCDYYRQIAELAIFLHVKLCGKGTHRFTSPFYQPLKAYLAQILHLG